MSDRKTFYFTIAGKDFEVKAGMHCIINLKKVMGIGVEEIFDPTFNWADEENLRGTVAGVVYRQIRKQERTNDPEDVLDAVGDLLDDALDQPASKRDKELERLGRVMLEIYTMSKWHKTPEQLIEAVNEAIEEQQEEKKRATKKTPRKSTGRRSKKTPGSSASKTASGI